MNQGQLSGKSPEAASFKLQARAGFPSWAMHFYVYLEIKANSLLKYVEFTSLENQNHRMSLVKEYLNIPLKLITEFSDFAESTGRCQ